MIQAWKEAGGALKAGSGSPGHRCEAKSADWDRRFSGCSGRELLWLGGSTGLGWWPEDRKD